MESQISFYDWVNSCNLMLVLVEIGKRVTSFSGFFHMIINGMFRYIAQVGDPVW